MDETALSVEVEHDFLPEWNRMLPLPKGEDDIVTALSRRTRLRLWRKRPGEANELRTAAEAEVAGAVEAGHVASDDAAGLIDRVERLLASDTLIDDPPRRRTVEHVLEDSRMKLRRLLRPRSASQGMEFEPCPFDVDRYGNFPGVNWREVLDWGLERVCRWPYKEPPSTSYRIAWRILRDELTREAEAAADREAVARREKSDLAVASLPVVFEGDQQWLLSFLRRLHAGGDFVEVPTDGNPVAEAELLRQVRAFDTYEMNPAQQAEVASELMRVVAKAEAEAAAAVPLIVPGLGYEIKVEARKIVDVFPGNLTLTIEGREHVLNSPELSRPVRLSAKEFRDPRLCALAIYEQVLVEVDIPRGHWRRWWPVLAERLRKTATIVEDGDRIKGWGRFVAGAIAAAPRSSHWLPDGAPYWDDDGKPYVGKAWLIERALASGVIGPADRKAFSDWLGTADRNRRDAAGGQHKMLAIGENGPLCIEGTFEPVEKSEVAGSSGTNMP
ncbi:MAG: hypothetical protein FJ284_14120 [Planctomycetes bacterium]|nr:hypothetical protein [Planctomycetota bacterium]